ncbi:hypothetical protein FOA52_002628 [Chlamydomonas sp. UWO 241]|nr:hypothetical protein FOA52_002628 [Chlamydomonas sp. UWO 241]
MCTGQANPSSNPSSNNKNSNNIRNIRNSSTSRAAVHGPVQGAAYPDMIDFLKDATATY